MFCLTMHGYITSTLLTLSTAGPQVGDVMLLKDHINMPGFSGVSPLTGPNDTRFGPRFFPVTGCYAPCWRRVAKEVAQEMDMEGDVHEGVYAMVGGPTFETVAEIKMFALLGVDCMGDIFLSLFYFTVWQNFFQE